LHAARALLVKLQTMLANAMRGLATGFGVTVPKEIRTLDEPMTLLDEDEHIQNRPYRPSLHCMTTATI
jgi:transposase